MNETTKSLILLKSLHHSDIMAYLNLGLDNYSRPYYPDYVIYNNKLYYITGDKINGRQVYRMDNGVHLAQIETSD